jgi:mRNA interferase MazF
MVRAYEPERGDLAWINFNPQSGREQAKNRAALVLSPRVFNVRTGLLFACPITSRDRGRNTHVAITVGKVTGFVMSEQLRSLDWRTRGAKLIAPAPSAVLDAVLERIGVILQLPE